MANSIVKSFPTLLLEVAMIVIGVMIGLLANNWREHRIHQKEAQASLRLIQQEIEGNQNRLEDILDSRKKMDTSFQMLFMKLMQDPDYEFSFAEVMGAMGGSGVKIPLLESSAYELSHQTGNFQYIDMNLAAGLSNLYSIQNAYQKTQDHIYQNGYVAGNIDLKNLGPTVLTTSAILKDMLHQEEILVNREYPKVLELLKAE